MLFVLGVCWLAQAAWVTDIIGPIQCDGLGGQRTATKNGDMNAQTYCYEMKVIQAFSWMTFILMALFLVLVISLAGQAETLGRPDIWSAPIQELGWFGEYPGYYNHGQTPMGPMGYPGYSYPPMMMPGTAGTPGQSIVIQPHSNGQPATVTQVPHSRV